MMLPVEILMWLVRLVGILGMLYLILISLYTIGWYFKPLPVAEEANDHTADHAFRVSILIAARNEQENISLLLHDLHQQRYNHKLMEIILVDDHSTDATSSRALQFIQEHPNFNCQLIASEKHGKKAALSQALKKAKNEIVLFTDADCRLGPGWVSTMLSVFKHDHIRLALGPVLIDPAASLFGRLQALEMISLTGSTAGSCDLGFPVMANGANLGFRRSVGNEQDYHDFSNWYTSGDDVFLMLSVIRKYGRKAVMFAKSTDAIVRTEPAGGLMPFFQQRLRWVSKSRGYNHPMIVIPALIVGFFNLSLVFVLLSGIFEPAMLLVYLLFVGFKTFVDYPVLLATSRFMKRTNLLVLIFPLQLIYPVYVALSGIAGLLLPFTWKGRSYRK